MWCFLERKLHKYTSYFLLFFFTAGSSECQEFILRRPILLILILQSCYFLLHRTLTYSTQFNVLAKEQGNFRRSDEKLSHVNFRWREQTEKVDVKSFPALVSWKEMVSWRRRKVLRKDNLSDSAMAIAPFELVASLILCTPWDQVSPVTISGGKSVYASWRISVINGQDG